MLPTHNPQSFGGGQGLHEDHTTYDDHDHILAGTVPRPEPERLENVWRERDDRVRTASEHDELYNDSLRLGSRMPASNNAPYASNLQTMPIAARGPEV